MPSRTVREPVVMVVEDFRDSREMLRLLLEGEGYRIFTAANGHEALKIAKHTHLDLILTDFGLPDMDGLALVRQLRKVKGVEMLPIIMLTAIEGDESHTAALTAGCSDFLRKPVDIEKLESIMEELLRENISRGNPRDKVSQIARKGLEKKHGQ